MKRKRVLGRGKHSTREHFWLPFFLFIFCICLGAFALNFFLARFVTAAPPAIVSAILPTPGDRSVALKWTNPSSEDFTGTVIRYSTSAFPVSATDGVAGGDVLGSPNQVSTATINDLTNGATYFFSLFSYNAAFEYSVAAHAIQIPMKAVFSDDFQSESVAAVAGQEGWTALGGSWNVIDTAGEHTLKGSDSTTANNLNRVKNSGAVTDYGNQMLRMDVKLTGTASVPFLFLRSQSASVDAPEYLMVFSGTTLVLGNKMTAGSGYNTMASTAITALSTGTWYSVEFDLVNDASGKPVLSGYYWLRGQAKPSAPVITATDTYARWTNGGFAFGKGATVAQVEYDNVVFYGMPMISGLSAVPGDGSIQLSWTNPLTSGFTGTMVRSSTSAYPTTPSDGTLVGDITGDAGGSGTVTQGGLTNGDRYYFSLFPYESSGGYGTPSLIQQVAEPLLFETDFSARTTGVSVDGQDGWSVIGGNWQPTDLLGNRVLSGDDGAVTYLTDKAENGTSIATDQLLKARFQSTIAANTAGYYWLRQQSDHLAGYLFFHNGNTWTIAYITPAGEKINLATGVAISPLFATTWFQMEASVVNNDADLPLLTLFVWREGTQRPAVPTLQTVDTTNRYPSGVFALGKNNIVETDYYDDVSWYGEVPVVPKAITVSPVSGNTAETGSSATASVALSAQPTADVSVMITSADTTEGIVFPSSLVFTSSNWDTPQTVTVTGVDDALDDGDIPYLLVIDPAVSQDAGYQGLDADDMGLLNMDNDTSGVVVSPVSGDTAESGAMATLTVVLASEPFFDVSFSLSSSNEAEGTIATSFLLFTAADWNIPQTVSVTGVDDAVADGPVAYTISLDPASSLDAGYNGLNPDDITLNNTDNDTASVLVTQSEGSTLLFEGGAGDAYTVYLSSQPLADVTVTVHPYEDVRVEPPSLVFTSGNWSIPQMMVATGVDDARAEGTHTGTLTHSASSDDPAYNAIGVSDVNTQIFDNDIVGITLEQSNSSTMVTELGATDTIDVVLRSQPSNDVTVTLFFSGTDIALSQSSLTFSPENWNVTQSLQVIAVDDPNLEGPEMITMTFVVSSMDVQYDHAALTPIGIRVTENEQSSHASPSPAQPTLTILSPGAGASFLPGSSLQVRWDSTGNISLVDVDLSVDEGKTWQTQAPSLFNSGFFSFTVPDRTFPRAFIRVRGTDLATTLAVAISPPFAIQSSPSNTSTPTSQEQASPATPVVNLPEGIAVHALIKLQDDGDPTTSSDTAVYYLDALGTRHVFRSDSVFFSWYCDASAVQIVSLPDLLALPFGSNVTERPGMRLVKFFSDPKVYAVDVGGSLRWITTEELATALFGKTWRTTVDEMSDVYFSNFHFGRPIVDVTQYNQEAAKRSAKVPSDILALPGYEKQTSENASCTESIIESACQPKVLVPSFAQFSDVFMTFFRQPFSLYAFVGLSSWVKFSIASLLSLFRC